MFIGYVYKLIKILYFTDNHMRLYNMDRTLSWVFRGDMKIVAVEPIFVDRYLFVRIKTDNGLTGVGEAGTWGFLEAAAGAVEVCREYLLGSDPLRIEYHGQYLYKSSHFRGAAIMGALSAVDIALWDIAGQYYDVPVYRLLGGGDRCRDKLRTYVHVKSPSIDEHLRLILKAKEEGYTAVGHLNPFLDVSRDEIWKTVPFAKKIQTAVENVARFRESAGDDMDLCLELHRRLDFPEAVALAKGIERYYPMFYEDPIRPENLDLMGDLAKAISLPIAGGERYVNLEEFAMLLSRGAVRYARISVCAIGGLTVARKIASMAEGFGVKVVPHNPANLSPLSTAACVQLSAAISNFSILEIPRDEFSSRKRNIIKSSITIEEGYIPVPERPGIGAALSDDVIGNPDFSHAVRGAKAVVMDDGSCATR